MKPSHLYWTLRILALVAMTISLYSMLQGNSLSKYWSGIALGIVLYGAAAGVRYREKVGGGE